MTELIDIFNGIVKRGILVYECGLIRKEIFYSDYEQMFMLSTKEIDSSWKTEEVNEVFVLNQISWILFNEVDFDFRGQD